MSEFHMIGFFLDPGMKHLPECSEHEKGQILSEVRHMIEIIKIEDGVEDFENRFSTVSTASEDSTPGILSKRRF